MMCTSPKLFQSVLVSGFLVSDDPSDRLCVFADVLCPLSRGHFDLEAQIKGKGSVTNVLNPV